MSVKKINPVKGNVVKLLQLQTLGIGRRKARETDRLIVEDQSGQIIPRGHVLLAGLVSEELSTSMPILPR